MVGDIKSCFHQVFVDENDHDAFRFFWFPNNDLEQSPADYRMDVHIFGAMSSPSIAAFALRRAALDKETRADLATVETVLENIYVDNLCKSCTSVKQAISLVDQLRRLLSSGGFRITKFLSNNKQVLDSIPPEDHAAAIDDRQLPTHKTLGVFWNAETDQLEVKIDVQQNPCTRRGVLSMIGQCYVPLGILGPFLLPARRVLQEACRLGFPWDKPFSVRGWAGRIGIGLCRHSLSWMHSLLLEVLRLLERR